MEPSRPQHYSPLPHADRPVFIRHDGAGTRLWVAPGLDAALRDLALETREAFERLLAPLTPDRSRSAGRARTTLIDVGGVQVHVKRALKGGAIAPLFAGRVPTWRRVANELYTGSELNARGAPVPRPVFAAGRFDALGWRAVLGSVLVPTALDGASALARADLDLQSVFRTFGRAIRTFHDLGGRHADLAITNLLFVPADGRAWVVDLQGSRAGAPPSPRRRQRELARLKRSIARRPAIEPLLASGWPDLIAAYSSAAGSDAGGSDAGDGAASVVSDRLAAQDASQRPAR